MIANNISKEILLKILKEFNPNFIDKVIITNSVEEILTYKNRDKCIWLNLVQWKVGDFNTYIQINESEENFGSFIKFGKFLAKNIILLVPKEPAFLY